MSYSNLQRNNVSKKTVFASMIGVLSLAIAGCGGSDQDQGTSSRVNVSGLGLDGYLVRSEVFQDMNNNGVRDAFERLVYTDDDGYYGYNPITGVNYCDSATEASLQERHCLAASAGSYPIIVRGGYDLVTGEPFHGNMRKTVDVRSTRTITEVDVITPITTVLSYVPVDQLESVKTKFGITDADLNRDFYNRSATVISQTTDIAKDQALVELTQKLHKTVSAAAKIAEASYDVEDKAELPADATPFIYDAIAESLIEDAVANIDAVIQDATKVTEMMTRAKTKIEARYLEEEVTLPAATQSLGDALLDATSITNITKIPEVIEQLVESLPDDQAPTIATTKASAKAIEVAVTKVAKQKPTAEIDAVIATVSDDANRDTLLTVLNQDSTNISTLTDVDVSDAAAVSTATTIRGDGQPVFINLANKRLVFSESNIQANEDMSALLYFSATSDTATSGTLSACVRFVDGLESDGSLKSGGSLGTFTDVGTWSQLNSGYAVVLDFEVAGAKRQATIQYGGETESGDQHIYRTDIGDGLETWNGDTIPTTYETAVPTDDATCRTEIDSVDPMDATLINNLNE